MTSLTVIGAGAVGGTLAAHLIAAHGDAVTIAARTPFSRLEVDAAAGMLRSTPVVVTDPAQARPADWVLVATKAYDADAAAAWLPAMTGPDTTIAALQNGVEHVERFAPHVPAERILPVIVDVPAFRSAPGVIVQRGQADLTVPDSPAGRRFAALFAGTGVRVLRTDDITTAAWRKLALNAPGAITAATLATHIDLAAPGAADLVRRTIEEAVAVGHAEGADLPDDLVDGILRGMADAGPGLPNSLHADRLAGRPMEIDARNGAIVRIGARHGIPTPVNATLVALLEIAASSADG